MIHVVIRTGNAAKYVETCLDTLNKQTETWKGVLVIDAPEDDTYAIAQKFISNRNLPIEITLNEKRMGLGYNLWYGINLIRNPDPKDIVCIVDGDDWLEKDALTHVLSAYKKHPNCLLTYGSYIKESKGDITRVSKRIAEEPIRKTKWATSHLKTFKYKLWQSFPKEYLQHEGVWAEAASDRGLMYGLVEIAGIENCIHIKRPVYHWRDSTPHKTEIKLQKKWKKIFREKTPLNQIKEQCPATDVVEFMNAALEKDKMFIVEDPLCPVLLKTEERCLKTDVKEFMNAALKKEADIPADTVFVSGGMPPTPNAVYLKTEEPIIDEKK